MRWDDHRDFDGLVEKARAWLCGRVAAQRAKLAVGSCWCIGHGFCQVRNQMGGNRLIFAGPDSRWSDMVFFARMSIWRNVRLHDFFVCFPLSLRHGA